MATTENSGDLIHRKHHSESRNTNKKQRFLSLFLEANESRLVRYLTNHVSTLRSRPSPDRNHSEDEAKALVPVRETLVLNVLSSLSKDVYNRTRYNYAFGGFEMKSVTKKQEVLLHADGGANMFLKEACERDVF